MKIRITQSIAMIDISPKPGDIVERDDDEARALIAAGHAEPAAAASRPAGRSTSRAIRRGAETRGG